MHLLFREIFEWPNECESALGLHSSQPLSNQMEPTFAYTVSMASQENSEENTVSQING
jgi:hypothetical protein